MDMFTCVHTCGQHNYRPVTGEYSIMPATATIHRPSWP